MPNFNSDLITNTVATPPVRNRVGLGGGRERRKTAKYAFAGAQANADTLRMMRIKSNDVPNEILLSCDALTGMTNVDVGLYLPGNAGAVVDVNLFDSAQTLATALVRQEKRVGTNSAFTTSETLGQTVWELLGLSADPVLEYDLVLTLIASGTASGDVILELVYNAGD